MFRRKRNFFVIITLLWPTERGWRMQTSKLEVRPEANASQRYDAAFDEAVRAMTAEYPDVADIEPLTLAYHVESA